jgi:putative CocE/NonD family hydrolase
VARVTTTCVVDEWFYKDGALRLQMALPWLDFAFGNKTLAGTPPTWDVSRMPSRAEVLPPDLRADWLGRGPTDPFWDAHSLRGTVLSGAVHVPVLHWTAWWDPFLRGQLRDYRDRRHGGHKHDRLLIDSADHEFNSLRAYQSTEQQVGVLAAAIRGFHDAIVNGTGTTGGSITLARAGESGPPSAMAPERLYLRDVEAARHGPEGGALDSAADVLPTPVVWVDDPADPVPNLESWIWGPLREGLPDEVRVQVRSDVLTFTGHEIQTSRTLLGKVSLHVRIRAQERKAHLVATLTDVRSDGHATRICDGVAVVHTVDEWVDIVLDLGPVGYVMHAAHRLRLSIAASSFPRYPASVPTRASWWVEVPPPARELRAEIGARSFLLIEPDDLFDERLVR